MRLHRHQKQVNLKNVKDVDFKKHYEFYNRTREAQIKKYKSLRRAKLNQTKYDEINSEKIFFIERGEKDILGGSKNITSFWVPLIDESGKFSGALAI